MFYLSDNSDCICTHNAQTSLTIDCYILIMLYVYCVCACVLMTPSHRITKVIIMPETNFSSLSCISTIMK